MRQAGGYPARVHVVILGCGRVGSALARALVKRDHSVAIIDQDAGAFHRLGEDFAGRTVTGIGFDREILSEAGIEHADAFAAVSSGDNSNIIAARVARETFGVERVVARIYDPRRAEVYERLGIPTVATVRWTADQILRRVLLDSVNDEWADTSGRIRLIETAPGERWVGRRVVELEEAARMRVVCVSRLGEGLLPDERLVIQYGDRLHVAVEKERFDEVNRVLHGGPVGERVAR
jgi:trk system potassium uptake protein TrkA